MKVLITHDKFPPDVIGGGEILLFKTAELLKERGFSVEVVSSGNSNIKSYKGVRTERIPVNRYLMNLSFPIITRHAYNADIIHTNSGSTCFPSWVTSKVINKPICCHIHHIFGEYWDEVFGYAGIFARSYESFILNRDYDALIFQNDSSKKIGVKMGMDKKRMHLLHPGIDHKNYQLRTKKNPFVLWVGNLNMSRMMCKIKGIEYLLEAAKRIPDVKFVVAGKGAYLDELKKNASRNVVFVGGVSKNRLIKLYNQASIFVMASLNEGFGISLLEAMASGCAVVSTIDIGQKGIKIRQKNVDDIVKAINYYINRPNIAKRAGNQNRKIAKKFTWDRYIHQIIKIYDSISKY